MGVAWNGTPGRLGPGDRPTTWGEWRPKETKRDQKRPKELQQVEIWVQKVILFPNSESIVSADRCTPSNTGLHFSPYQNGQCLDPEPRTLNRATDDAGPTGRCFIKFNPYPHGLPRKRKKKFTDQALHVKGTHDTKSPPSAARIRLQQSSLQLLHSLCEPSPTFPLQTTEQLIHHGF